MVKEKRITTIEEILEIISEQEFDARVNRHRSHYLYRGLPNENYKLESSLKRNCKDKQSELEKSILRNFTKYAEITDPMLKGCVWRQMIRGQHHGLPTRLMDWTYSPLMGLHFALSGEDLSKMDAYDCVLWKIDNEEINSLLPSSYQDQLNKHSAFLLTINMLGELAKDLSQYDADMGNKAMALLEPPSIDERIINQYSYFTVIPHGMTDVEGFLNTHTDKTVKYIIDKNLRWRIRDMLDQMNINERVAYPGLEGLSLWLKRHYYVK